MAWFYLVAAGLFEIAWAAALKSTAGFTRPLPSVVTLILMTASLGLLGLAVRTLPLSVAYAVWTGIGTAGAVLIGVLLLGEPLSPARAASVALIAAGIAGLKLAR